MASSEYVIKERLDTSGLEQGVVKTQAGFETISRDAQKAGEQVKAMFDTPAMREAAANFEGVEKAVNRYVNAMSKQLPMKRELRETQMAAQELEQVWRELNNAEKESAAGQELRAKIDTLISRGGVLRDTMVDVASAIRFEASDTAKLDAVVGGINMLAATAQAASGAMQLLGMSQEDSAKVQADLMAVMGVVNALQTIQNALQKESAVMMGLNAARTAALSAAISVKAAVTKADTIASKAAAVAQWAWNAAMTANPIGLVVAAVAALCAGIALLIKRTNEATDAQKGEQSALLDVRDAMADAHTKTAEAELQLGSYVEQVRNFNGTAEQEKQLVDEINSKYGKQIGYFKDLGDAKAHLAELSQWYIKQMEEEAKATALAAAYGDTYAKMIKGEISSEEATAKLAKLKDAWRTAAEGAKYYASQIRAVNNLAGRSTEDPAKAEDKPATATAKVRHTTAKSTTEQLVQGSVEWYNAEIQRLNKLAEKQTDVFKMRAIQEQAAALQAEKNLKFGDLGKGVDVNELRGTLSDRVNLALQNVKLKPLAIHFDIETPLEAAKRKSQNLLDSTEGLRTAATAAAGAFRQLGNAIGGQAGKMVNVAAVMAQAIATMIQGYATATAQAAKLGPWAWAAFGLTGLGQLMSMIAAVKSAAGFANGGIVGGNSYSGDRQYIRVNSGEMILNRGQQASLWNAINGSARGGGEVTFRIAGQQLVGVLNNYNSKMGKIR